MSEFSHKRTWGPTPIYDYVKGYAPTDNSFHIISGSCSVESEDHIYSIAKIVAQAGATHLRGGVFRAGTYPRRDMHFGYIDMGLIKHYHQAAKENGLKNIIEIIDYREEVVDKIAQCSDVFQVGARAQQHYPLLRFLPKYGKPIYLKRHPGSTVDECLGSVEHLLTAGAKDVRIIERGSSTYHNDCRWTPSVHVIPSIQSICRVPVIWDASHSTGRRDLVPSVCLAGVAAGANGILVECHETPTKSLSDADQAIDPNTLKTIIEKTHKIRSVL
jgi:3-deoxy-7-phosphoheptulonate synthase